MRALRVHLPRLCVGIPIHVVSGCVNAVNFGEGCYSTFSYLPTFER